MSEKALVPIRPYSNRFRRPKVGSPSATLCWFTIATTPAHKGDETLVPMKPVCIPLRTTKAEVFPAAAIAATSGTHRRVPGGTPFPACHDGRGKKPLMPPPLARGLGVTSPISDHVVSKAMLPFELKSSVVPPTPVILGSLAG